MITPVPPQTALFVPLKTEYFKAFQRGAKTVEYRRYGPRWNERTCAVGRHIRLSHGYSGARLAAVITGFCVIYAAEIQSTIYPPDTPLATISLRLT